MKGSSVAACAVASDSMTLCANFASTPYLRINLNQRIGRNWHSGSSTTISITIIPCSSSVLLCFYHRLNYTCMQQQPITIAVAQLLACMLRLEMKPRTRSANRSFDLAPAWLDGRFMVYNQQEPFGSRRHHRQPPPEASGTYLLSFCTFACINHIIVACPIACKNH